MSEIPWWSFYERIDDLAGKFEVVAVVGLGAIGSRLATVLARSGRTVIAVERDGEALAAARPRVERLLAAAAPAHGTAMGDVVFADSTDAARGALLGIEAVPEQLSLKIAVLSRLHRLISPDAPLVTTTTGLSVTRLGAASGRIALTVGWHFGPVEPVAHGVELVTTTVTDSRVRECLTQLLRELGHAVVPAPDRLGFVGGGLAMAYLNSAVAMLDQGYASREEIDQAMVLGCGVSVGPLAHLDEMGLDVARDALDALYNRSGNPLYAPRHALSHLVKAGWLGRKTGRGFYRYASDGPPESVGGRSVEAAPLPNPSDLCQPGVQRVGVVGSGTMATGIAQVFCAAGYETTVVGRALARVEAARVLIEEAFARRVRRGRLSAGALAQAMECLTATVEMESLRDCDLVVEATTEDLATKRTVFARLDQVCRPDAVLATTTSSLPVIECAMATTRPERVVGMHFFNPAPVMALVEVVGTVRSNPAVLTLVTALCRALGKRPIECRDRTGFIVNSLLFPYLNRAAAMLTDAVADADEIDTVMREAWGHPMGPIELLDVIGLDVSMAISTRLREASVDPGWEPAEALGRLVEAGMLGRKSGSGLRGTWPDLPGHTRR